MEAILQYGLIKENDIILKKESELQRRKNLEEVIIETIINYIEEILIKLNIRIKDIAQIGIAAPRKYKRWSNS